MKQILILSSLGLRRKQTALLLGISLRTVDNLTDELFYRLGAVNSANAAYLAAKRGLLVSIQEAE